MLFHFYLMTNFEKIIVFYLNLMYHQQKLSQTFFIATRRLQNPNKKLFFFIECDKAWLIAKYTHPQTQTLTKLSTFSIE